MTREICYLFPIIQNYDERESKKDKKSSSTSSSQVFLWAGDGGTQTCPFSREFSITRRRAFDKSCLMRGFLEFQPMVDGDSDPVISTT